jgi:nitric oxide dioxygenase
VAPSDVVQSEIRRRSGGQFIAAVYSVTRALGARHVGYGVRAADYQTVGDSLIAALAGTLGEEFDATTREAWVLAFNIVAETMLEGAASARPIGS